MSDGMRRELAYLSSHATNRYFIPNWGKAYQPIPVIVEFKNEDGSDNLKETIEANYRKVKQEILTLVDSEIQRIKNTPALSHLIPDK